MKIALSIENNNNDLHNGEKFQVSIFFKLQENN